MNERVKNAYLILLSDKKLVENCLTWVNPEVNYSQIITKVLDQFKKENIE